MPTTRSPAATPASVRRLEHPAERLVAEHEPVAALGRPAVLAARDLAVGAADAERERLRRAPHRPRSRARERPRRALSPGGPVRRSAPASARASPAPARRPALRPGRGQQQRAVDEADVAEGLREVADEPASARVVFLRRAARRRWRARAAARTARRPRRGARAARGVDEPERARQEGALAGRQPVVGLLGRVAQHEPVAAQLALDRLDRARDARVVGGEEADEPASAAARRRAPGEP